MVSLEPLTTRGAVRVTWTPPTDLCGLTNPQYTIQYGKSTSTYTTTFSTPSSSQFDITGLEVGQQYFVRLAVRTQSGSGTFSSWESVTTYEGVRAMSLHYIPQTRLIGSSSTPQPLSVITLYIPIKVHIRGCMLCMYVCMYTVPLLVHLILYSRCAACLL